MPDTINVAARMESTSRPGCIHISEDTHGLLEADPGWQPVGGIQVGKEVCAVHSMQQRVYLLLPCCATVIESERFGVWLCVAWSEVLHSSPVRIAHRGRGIQAHA